MKLSAKQAAKETGKSVPTITRAIKSGKISAEKNANGGYEIDPAELFRVFPAKTRGGGNVTPSVLPFETPNVTSALEVEIKFLREKVTVREEQLREKAEMIENLSNKLDKAQGTIDKQTLLIEYQTKHDRPVDWAVWIPPTACIFILLIVGYVVKY